MQMRRIVDWLRGLFGAPRPKVRRRPTRARAERETTPAPEPGPEEFPDPLQGVGNLDAAPLRATTGGTTDALVERVRERVLAGDFELPQLPGTTMTILSLARDVSADMRELTQRIQADPVLSSQLLKLASSALYGSQPVNTIHEAVMRVGLRSLRSMILAASMRGAILTRKEIQRYGEEIWRQAFSVASIARELGPLVGRDPEEAFLLGLLHDIGKVCLLQIVSEEMSSVSDVASHVIGRIFIDLHEEAGARMAEAWALSDELVSVAGCHHRFLSNEEHPREAAFVRLAHHMDMYLSLGAREEYDRLRRGEEMQFLRLDDDEQSRLLFRRVREVYVQVHEMEEAKAA
jgi:putative nucleotidyltransferase with HDIG domain